MNKTTYILLAIIFIFGSCKTAFYPIAREKFEWYYKTRKVNKILIDTRSEIQYKRSNLKYSIHIPIDTKNLKKQIFSRFKKEPDDIWILFVYAHTKQETTLMLQKLEKIYSHHLPFSGPTAVYYLKGGFATENK